MKGLQLASIKEEEEEEEENQKPDIPQAAPSDNYVYDVYDAKRDDDDEDDILEYPTAPLEGIYNGSYSDEFDERYFGDDESDDSHGDYPDDDDDDEEEEEEDDDGDLDSDESESGERHGEYRRRRITRDELYYGDMQF